MTKAIANKIAETIVNGGLASMTGYAWHLGHRGSAIGMLAFIVLNSANFIVRELKK